MSTYASTADQAGSVITRNGPSWNAINPERFDLPVSQKAYNENLVFHHSVLLGTKKDMDSIVEAFAKVKKAASELP